MRHAVEPRADAGFALIETIAALLLSTLVLLAVTTGGGLLVRHAAAISARSNEAEMLIAGVDALRRDVESVLNIDAESVAERRLAFRGGPRSLAFVTFVHGLDGVAEAVRIDAQGDTLARSATQLRIAETSATRAAEPAVLLAGPWRYRFGYRAYGSDATWLDSWHDDVLPAVVRLSVMPASDSGEPVLVVDIRVRANGARRCGLEDSCDTESVMSEVRHGAG